MSRLADRIGSLPPEKRALLEERLLRRRASNDDGIPKRAAGERVPLSFSQQRLWFMDEWDRGAPTYNAALPLCVRGALNVDALRNALEAVISRHESLRTVFALDGEGPVQKVLESAQFDLSVIDLRQVAIEGRGAEVERVLRERARRPFDLARDLMLRLTVVRVDEDEWVLNFEEHHIAFDGWSDEIMFRELEEVYSAQVEKRDPKLEEIPLQYGDFTLWQSRRMQGDLLDEHLSYWRRQLAASPPTLRLQTDFPRPAIQTFDGAHLDVTMPREVADGVRELARSEAATPYITLLAVFGALLYRMTGQDDLLIGTPMANRGRLELEQLIGFFSNTVVMRLRLGGNPTFRELVRRVREVALGAFVHQECPFEKVVDAVRPMRDAGLNPLFQVNFRVQTAEPATLVLPGLEVEPMTLDLGFSRFDLALELQLRDDTVRGYLEYNVDLFRRETAEGIVDEFERVLTDVLSAPDEPLLALALRHGALGGGAPRIPSSSIGKATIPRRPNRNAHTGKT